MSSALPWNENWGVSYKLRILSDQADPTKSGKAESKLDTNPRQTDRALLKEELAWSNVNEDGTRNRGFTFNYENRTALSVDGNLSDVATISLYNLSNEEIALLEKENMTLELSMGFEGEVVQEGLFDIVGFDPIGNGEYQIDLMSSGRVLLDTVLNTQYDETLSELDILKDLASKADLALTVDPNIAEVMSNKRKTGGRVLRGALEYNLEQMARKNSFVWTVSKGTLICLGEKVSLTAEQQTGLTSLHFDSKNIKMIRKNQVKKADQSDPLTKVQQITMNTYYVGAVIGDYITVDSDPELDSKFYGSYVVTAVRTIGQSKGNAWDNVLVAQQI